MWCREVHTEDLDAMHALNEREVPHVSSVDRRRLAELVAMSQVALVAVDEGVVVGFVLALAAGAPYDSPNYTYFSRRGGRFLYVDRIVVAPGSRRSGVASRLYDEVDAHAVAEGFDEVTCEVNLRPVNPTSLAFHLQRGFVEVGRQTTTEGAVEVLLLTRRLAAHTPTLTPGHELGHDPVDADAIEQLRRWIDEASRMQQPEPTAMALATVDAEGTGDVRMILCRGVDARGLRFFTNLESPKARHLTDNPHAAALFYWPQLHRQARVRGTVDRLSDEECDDYFATRPRGAQIGAWASRQSTPIEDRRTLDAEVARIDERFAGVERIPRPRYWGGFVLSPETVEFWKGRADRLHDRLRFDRTHDGWSMRRLQP